MGEQNSFTQFPYEFKELEPEAKELLAKLYTSQPDMVSVGPKGYKVLRPYCEFAENIYNMPLRSTDIFVASFQRSGTTWTQELIWLLAKDLDYTTAKTVPLTQRYSYLESVMIYNKKWQENFLKNTEDKESALALTDRMVKPTTEKLLSAPSPRFIKTHLPMSLLPPKLLDTAKVVYVARDPRDVAVSAYHFSKFYKVVDFQFSLKDFWNLFVKDLYTFTPFFPRLKEAWELRNHPNMLFLFYEELSKDLPAVIHRVADFLGKEVTEEQMTRLCDHLSFENFKKNEAVNFEHMKKVGNLPPNETFIRKGKVGGWRSYFDEEMTEQAEQWIAKNLKDTDLRFPNM